MEANLTNLVFMGMGEPLDNFDNVALALRLLNDPRGSASPPADDRLDLGLVPGIARFKSLGLQSTCPSRSMRRRRLAEPADARQPAVPAPELIAACEDYLGAGAARSLSSYVLLKGVNDRTRTRSAWPGYPGGSGKVNAIAFSPVAGIPFERPEEASVEDFIRG
jgi:23S rRNA (adenine2503-C2)-methyltransferase